MITAKGGKMENSVRLFLCSCIDKWLECLSFGIDRTGSLRSCTSYVIQGREEESYELYGQCLI